tara:strand:- start:842 stop:1111 length:270 start_codon:yes stop_codon:yes gene_type:complete
MRVVGTVNIVPDGKGLLRFIREGVLPDDRPLALRMLGTFSVTVDGVSRPIGAMEAQDILDGWQKDIDEKKAAASARVRARISLGLEDAK